MSNEFRFLGHETSRPGTDLDTFPKPETVTRVSFTSDELTSFCPVTGQPDFNHVLLEYRPDQLCVESKSLKLYLWSFRDAQIFGENLADAIARHIFEAVAPFYCRVTLTQNIRGGMQLTAVAEIGQAAGDG